MLKQAIKIVIVTLMIYGMGYAQADFPETRGKILTSTGTPTLLSPVGGYIAKSNEIVEGVGKKGLQRYYDVALGSGTDVQTSIHSQLQNHTERMIDKTKVILDAKEVLAMVMNSKTGELLTIATSNRYDPLYIRQKDIPSLNPKFAEYPYEPGAVMMPFTIAMSLNVHLIGKNKDKKWINTDYDKFSIGNGLTISDDNKQVAQTMTDVLVNSSSIGIAQIAMELTGNIFYYALNNYGFGQKSGIDLPRDLTGMMKTEIQLESKTYRANTAYGYGIMVTPIQLLKAYSTFSNDGMMVTPHIGTSETYEAKEVLFKGNAQKVKQMLIEVVKRGTGKNAQIEGLTIGGKTGTAHIAKNGKYTNDYHSSFYGFVEDGEHSYTIGVLVIEAKAPKMYFASKSAVPTFRKVVEEMVVQKLLLPGKGVAKKASPLSGSKLVKPFGMVTDATYGIKIFNESVTLQAGDDHMVKNIAKGKVVFAGKNKMLDNVVVVAHANKIHTVYAKLAEISGNIHVGTVVKEGQELGVVEDKLIFQVVQDAKYIDPLELIEL